MINVTVLFIALLIFYPFAIYRLAWLVSIDTGPLRIFESLRTYISKKYIFDSEGTSFIWQNLDEGINCTNCTGIWAAIILSPILFISLYHVYVGLVIFALGGAGMQLWLSNYNDDTVI